MLFSVNNSWKCRGLARELYINAVIWRTRRHSNLLLRNYPLGTVAQISGPSSPGRQNFVLWRLMWGPEYELASCHPSAAYNFEVVPRFLEKKIFCGPKQGQVEGACECVNEYSVCIRCGECLDSLKTC
jgi:hypothetical protein